MSFHLCKTDFKSGAHDSEVMSVRSVTERSLAQTPLWSLNVVCCALRQGTLSILSQSTQLKLGTGLYWELTYDRLVSNTGRVNDSQPRSTTEIGDMHRPYAPNGTEKDFKTDLDKLNY